MSDLNDRLGSYVAEVMNIPSIPPDQRNRTQLSKTVKVGRELLTEVRAGITERAAALSRAALLEDTSAGAYFGELDTLKSIEEELLGPLRYAEGSLARREGRAQLARSGFDEAMLTCPPELELDSAKALAEIHEKADLRTHYHAARGLVFTLDPEQKNPEVAGIEFREAISLEPGNAVAFYGTALLEEEAGELDQAAQTLMNVLALGAKAGEGILRKCYRKLQERLQAATSLDEIGAQLETLIQSAGSYEALHGEMLRIGFESEILDDAGRTALKDRLAYAIKTFANPAKRPEDAFDRKLLIANANHLTAFVEILSTGSLVVGDEQVESGGIRTSDEPHGGHMHRAVVARVLTWLWRSRMARVMGGKDDFGSSFDRMGSLVQCQDRMVRWLADAAETGVTTEAYYCLDLVALLTALGEMYASVNDDPVDGDSLLSLIPSDKLREQLTPVLGTLFRHLKRKGQSWQELGRLERLDEICLAVGIGRKMTEFAIGEMGANTYEHLLRTGDATARMHAHLHLAKLYLDQHRYELAIDNGQKAVELDARSSEAVYRLGMIYLKAGKRLLGIEALRDAAERFSHAEANVALAEDCVRDDQPHLAAQYYITAIENLLSSDRRIGSKDVDHLSDWLRRARNVNEDVQPFDMVIEKSLPRKERKQKKKELEAKNAQRQAEKDERAARIAELQEQYDRVRSRLGGAPVR